MERSEIIKKMATDYADNSILQTPLADFIPVKEDDGDKVSQLAQKVLNTCNSTDAQHNIVVASLALALFSACSSAFHTMPSPSNLIH